jgi:hypothetical protein
MNNKEILSVLLLAAATWLVLSAMWTLLGMAWTIMTRWDLDIWATRAGFEGLRNTAFIELWIGTFIGLIGLLYVGGDKDDVDDHFYYFFILVATVGSLVAALV